MTRARAMRSPFGPASLCNDVLCPLTVASANRMGAHRATPHHKSKRPQTWDLCALAEGQGFEPWVGY